MPGGRNTAKRRVSVHNHGGLCLLLVPGLPRAAAKALAESLTYANVCEAWKTPLLAKAGVQLQPGSWLLSQT